MPNIYIFLYNTHYQDTIISRLLILDLLGQLVIPWFFLQFIGGTGMLWKQNDQEELLNSLSSRMWGQCEATLSGHKPAGCGIPLFFSSLCVSVN